MKHSTSPTWYGNLAGIRHRVVREKQPTQYKRRGTSPRQNYPNWFFFWFCLHLAQFMLVSRIKPRFYPFVTTIQMPIIQLSAHPSQGDSLNIQIHPQDFTLTEGLREHVARRLAAH